MGVSTNTGNATSRGSNSLSEGNADDTRSRYSTINDTKVEPISLIESPADDAEDIVVDMDDSETVSPLRK